MSNKKEKHTTYTIGPVSRIRMLEVMREALREELLGDPQTLRGILLTLSGGLDDTIPTHFYDVDEWPSRNWWIRDLTKVRLEKGTSLSGGAFLRTLAFSYYKTLYGYVAFGVKFGERVGTKHFALAGPQYIRVEVTPTTFQFKTYVSVFKQHSPAVQNLTTTDLTWDYRYEDYVQWWLILWYPNLAMLVGAGYKDGVWGDGRILAWHADTVPNIPLGAELYSSGESELECTFVDFSRLLDIRKFQPPPLQLWENETVAATGEYTRKVPAHPYSAKTFYLISDQDGTVDIQVDLGDGVWRDWLTGLSVTANTLWSRQTTYDAQFMRLFFNPAAEATVSAWAVLRM